MPRTFTPALRACEDERQRLVLVGAVLGAEVDHAVVVLDGHAQQHAGVGRVEAQLRDFVGVVEGKPLHAVPDARDDVRVFLDRMRMEQALGRDTRRCRQGDLRVGGHINPVDEVAEQRQQLGVGVRFHRVVQLDARQTRSQRPDALVNARGSQDQKRRRHGSGENRRAIERQARLDGRLRQGYRRLCAVAIFHFIITSLPAKLPSNSRIAAARSQTAPPPATVRRS